MNNFIFDPLSLIAAIKSSTGAAQAVEDTASPINEAVSTAGEIETDLSEFVDSAPSMLEECADVSEIAGIIEEILADGITSEDELAAILSNYGVEKFTSVLQTLISDNSLSVSDVFAIYLPEMIRHGTLDISQVSSIFEPMLKNGKIATADIGIFLFELQRTNMHYIVDEEGVDGLINQLNDLYGHEFEYISVDENGKESKYYNERNYRKNIALKLKSEYKFNLADVSNILKPMFENGTINEDQLKEIMAPLTIFDKQAGTPDIYNNSDYNIYLKSFAYNGDSIFTVTVGNQSYKVNDLDRQLIKNVPGYSELMTGNEAFDNIFADVCVSDFVQAVHTKEMGSLKNKVDEALALGSVIINRTESTTFDYNGKGDSIVYQLTRGSWGEGSTVQYQPVMDKTYDAYMHGNTFNTVKVGMQDAMNGTRNTTALGFWGSGEVSVKGSLTEGGGNQYHHLDIDPVADRKVEYTGVIYEKQIETGAVTAGTKSVMLDTGEDIYNQMGYTRPAQNPSTISVQSSSTIPTSESSTSSTTKTSSVSTQDTSTVSTLDSTASQTKDTSTSSTAKASSTSTQDTSTVSTYGSTASQTKDTSTSSTAKTSSTSTQDTSTVSTLDSTPSQTKDTSTSSTVKASSASPKDTSTVSTNGSTASQTKDTSTSSTAKASSASSQDTSTVSTDGSTPSSSKDSSTSSTIKASSALSQDTSTVSTYGSMASPTRDITDNSTNNVSTASTADTPTFSTHKIFQNSANKTSTDSPNESSPNSLLGAVAIYESKKYIVQPGDTLSDIARRYGINYEDIIKDNQIQDANLIFPGQELIINVPKQQ